MLFISSIFHPLSSIRSQLSVIHEQLSSGLYAACKFTCQLVKNVKLTDKLLSAVSKLMCESEHIVRISMPAR